MVSFLKANDCHIVFVVNIFTFFSLNLLFNPQFFFLPETVFLDVATFLFIFRLQSLGFFYFILFLFPAIQSVSIYINYEFTSRDALGAFMTKRQDKLFFPFFHIHCQQVTIYFQTTSILQKTYLVSLVARSSLFKNWKKGKKHKRESKGIRYC